MEKFIKVIPKESDKALRDLGVLVNLRNIGSIEPYEYYNEVKTVFYFAVIILISNKRVYTLLTMEEIQNRMDAVQDYEC